MGNLITINIVIPSMKLCTHLTYWEIIITENLHKTNEILHLPPHVYFRKEFRIEHMGEVEAGRKAKALGDLVLERFKEFYPTKDLIVLVLKHNQRLHLNDFAN